MTAAFAGGRRASSWLLALGLVASGVTTAAAQPGGPTAGGQPPADGRGAPVAKFTAPTPGMVHEAGRVTITGTYSSTNKVTGVTVAACRPSSPTRCKDYLLSSTNGAFASPWRGMSARLAPSSADGRTGTFSLVLTGVPSSRLRLFAYASDGAVPKGPSTSVTTVVKAPADPSYISVVFGRANWVAAGGEGCVNRPAGARTLEQNALDLAARGIPGVAQVVLARVAETTHLCPDNFALEASWQDLSRLRERYGWTLTSQSRTYPDLTALPEAQVIAESLGTLPSFTGRGHDRAWGSFAYPNNRQNPTVQSIVMRYFAFGRVYASELNSRATATVHPYPMKTMSVNGGRCNNPALSCYAMPMVNERRTTSPQAIGRMLKPGPGKWGVVQFYRIVDGTEGKVGDSLAWNCSPTDWRDRWTSQPELYCRSSFLEAIDQRNKSAQAVDPATVALAWGRTPW